MYNIFSNGFLIISLFSLIFILILFFRDNILIYKEHVIEEVDFTEKKTQSTSVTLVHFFYHDIDGIKREIFRRVTKNENEMLCKSYVGKTLNFYYFPSQLTVCNWSKEIRTGKKKHMEFIIGNSIFSSTAIRDNYYVIGVVFIVSLIMSYITFRFYYILLT